MRSFFIGLVAGAVGVLFGLNYFGHISMDDFIGGSAAVVEDSADMPEEAAEADEAVAEDIMAEDAAAEEPAADDMMEEGDSMVEDDMGDAEEEMPAEDG